VVHGGDAQGRSGAQEQCWGRKRSRGGAAGGAQEQARQQEAAQGGWATVAQAWAKETAATSVRGCEGRRRAGARGKSRAGYVGSRDAMRRLGLHENL
jgi:hypothetical protein